MKKETIILIVIIAVLGAFLLLRNRSELNYTLPELKPFEKTQVTQISIKKENSTLTLSLKESQWVTEKESFPADMSLVDKMLDDAVNLKLSALASESGNLTLYELDDSHVIEVTLEGESGILRSFKVGKTASSYRHTFILLQNDDNVYHCEGNLKTTYDKTVNSIREKEIFSVDGDVIKADFTDGKSQFSFEKQMVPVDVNVQQKENNDVQPNLPVWKSNLGEEGDNAAIEGVFQSLKELKCDSFVTDTQKDALSGPEFTLEITDIDNKTQSLSVFEKSDAGYICTTSQSPYVFVLKEWAVNNFKKKKEDLLKKTEKE